MNSRLLAWTDKAWSDYQYWQDQDKKTLLRINKLLEDTKRSDPPLSVSANPNRSKKTMQGSGDGELTIPIV